MTTTNSTEIKTYISEKVYELSANVTNDFINKEITACFEVLENYKLTNQKIELVTDPSQAEYLCITYDEFLSNNEFHRRDNGKRYYIIFGEESTFLTAIATTFSMKKGEYIWERFNKDGYEVTSKGDRRFSPFHIEIPLSEGESTSMENYYHLYLKGYKYDGYTSWDQVKGKPPKKEFEEGFENSVFETYYTYLSNHVGLLFELAYIGLSTVFTDMFGTTNNSQARYYCDILNYIKSIENK